MPNIIKFGGGAGGGGLAIEIVGGTTQPASPKDNTIWVNTDVDIGTVTLAPNVPASPAVGDVWINTANKYHSDGTNASTNILKVCEEPYLEVNVLNISQYDGSAWVNRDGSAIFANEMWTNLALWIYSYGTENANYQFDAKLLETSSSWTASWAKYQDHIYMSNTGGANGNIAYKYPTFGINAIVNMTNFTKMSLTSLVYDIDSSDYGVNRAIQLRCASAPLSAATQYNYGASVGSCNFTISQLQTNIYDLTGVTNSGYPILQAYLRRNAYWRLYQMVFTA